MGDIVVAFDGLIAETLELRSEALAEACLAEHVPQRDAEIRHALPGRTLREAVWQLLGDEDATRDDLIAIRAQHDVSRRLAHGVLLAPHALTFLRAHQAAGDRLVLRADSVRRDVSAVLGITQLESVFTLVRCTDDAPRVAGRASIEGSYAAIRTRLGSLGPSRDRVALEYGAYAADVAREFLGESVRMDELSPNW